MSVLSQSVFKAQLYHNESDEFDDSFDEDLTSSNQNPFKGSILQIVPVEEDNEESKQDTLNSADYKLASFEASNQVKNDGFVRQNMTVGVTNQRIDEVFSEELSVPDENSNGDDEYDEEGGQDKDSGELTNNDVHLHTTDPMNSFR